MTTKQEIELALKKTIIPILRDMGFKGSLPNFRRIDEGFISLINFQFYSSGGSFCVNLSYAGPNRENVGHCPPAELNNLTVSHTRDRIRLGETQGDNWFSFGTTNYGECRGTPEPLSQIITTIGQLLRDQAEPWWKAKKKDFNNSQQGTPPNPHSPSAQGAGGCRRSSDAARRTNGAGEPPSGSPLARPNQRVEYYPPQ